VKGVIVAQDAEQSTAKYQNTGVEKRSGNL
jgi:hypothetical protein